MNKEIQTPAINPQQILSMKSSMAADKFAAALRSTKFPQERLSENWKDLAELAITKVTPAHLRISLKEFKEAFEADVDDLNLFEFGCLSNSIEQISYSDTQSLIGFSEEAYAETLEEAVSHIQHYNLETSKLRARIEKEVETEVSMRIAAEHGINVGTDSNKAINSLKPVIGEV